MSVAAERPKVSQPRPFLRPAIKEELTGWLFASPWIIGFLLFTAAPMLFSIYASFTDYNITTTPNWIGLSNYQRLFKDPYFFTSLGNTFWMVIVKTPFVIVIGIGLALLLAWICPAGAFSARSSISRTCWRALPPCSSGSGSWRRMGCSTRCLVSLGLKGQPGSQTRTGPSQD